MNNCKNCQYYCTVDQVKPFPGGAQVIFLNGYGCTKKLQEDNKISWYSDTDADTYCCSCFKLQ